MFYNKITISLKEYILEYIHQHSKNPSLISLNQLILKDEIVRVGILSIESNLERSRSIVNYSSILISDPKFYEYLSEFIDKCMLEYNNKV